MKKLFNTLILIFALSQLAFGLLIPPQVSQKHGSPDSLVLSDFNKNYQDIFFLPGTLSTWDEVNDIAIESEIWKPTSSVPLSVILTDPRLLNVKNIWLNGQSNDEVASKKLARFHTPLEGIDKSNKDPVVVIHNPSSGFGPDTFQSIMCKLFGAGKMEKRIHELLFDRAKSNTPTNMYVHSQGCIMGTNFLSLLDDSVDSWPTLRMEYHGSASNYYMSRFNVWKLDAQWGGMDNSPFDFVGIGIGGNSLVYLPLSVAWAPTLGIKSDMDRQLLGEKSNFWTKTFGSHHTFYKPGRKNESSWYKFFAWLY